MAIEIKHNPNKPLSIVEANNMLDDKKLKMDKLRESRERTAKAPITIAPKPDMWRYLAEAIKFLPRKDDRKFIGQFLCLCQHMKKETVYKKMAEVMYKRNDEIHISKVRNLEQRIFKDMLNLVEQKVKTGIPILGGA
jgi:hypothetical protein